MNAKGFFNVFVFALFFLNDPIFSDQQTNRTENPVSITGFGIASGGTGMGWLYADYHFHDSFSAGGMYIYKRIKAKEMIGNESSLSFGEGTVHYSQNSGYLFLRYFPLAKIPVYIAPYVSFSDRDVVGNESFRSWAGYRNGDVRMNSFGYRLTTGARADAGMVLGISWIFDNGFTIGYERGRSVGTRSKRKISIAYDERSLLLPGTIPSEREAFLLAYSMNEALSREYRYQNYGVFHLGWSFGL